MSDTDAEIFRSEMLELGWKGRTCPHGQCTGFVYVIFTRGRGYAKVGFTKSDPRLRVASLQTGNHLHLNLATFLPGNVDMERNFHAALAQWRVSGEWFKCPDEALEVLYGLIDEAWSGTR